MSAQNDKISRRQYIAVLFVALLSQHIRIVPRELALTAGRAAWLAPIAAAPIIIIYLRFIKALLRKKRADYSLRDVFTDSLGKFLGKALIFLSSVWIVFYSGFLLRNIAERFISTVYPYSGTTVFIVSMGALCFIACLGKYKAIARSAMIFRPILLTIIFFTLIVSLFSIDANSLLPVTPADAVPVGKAALKVVNIVGLICYMGFLEGHTGESVRLRDYLPWIGVLLVISVFLCVCAIGMYGAELTGKATLPVFLLARDLIVFGSVERVEPLIIAIWVLSDFVLISTVLFMSAENLRYCFSSAGEGKGCLDMSGGRWAIPSCCAAAVVIALVIGKDLVSMDLLSEQIIPTINIVYIFGLLPLIFLIGRVRRKI